MSKNNGNTKAKTWLITGASSGLGYALAEYALQQGGCVALSRRRNERWRVSSWLVDWYQGKWIAGTHPRTDQFRSSCVKGAHVESKGCRTAIACRKKRSCSRPRNC